MDAIENSPPRPPEHVRRIYKYYQILPLNTLNGNYQILDFHRGLDDDQKTQVRAIRKVSQDAAMKIDTDGYEVENQEHTGSVATTQIFEHIKLPGLLMIPNSITPKAHKDLLNQLMHACLANPMHNTNVHLHHHVPYSIVKSKLHNFTSYISMGAQESEPESDLTSSENASFFDLSPDLELFNPINPQIHKPFTVHQFLCKKLRWLTLGGQYDWTAKKYPAESPPPFPEEVASLVQRMFPEMKPEAAIVNVYSPGDTLSIHRDVSETSTRGLVSISLGCDAIFVVGIEGKRPDEPCIAVRLRSGDAIYMNGDSRFAWHGVPRIIANTCPEWLQAWPASTHARTTENDPHGRFEAWRDWMANKRINLNVRQMRE